MDKREVELRRSQATEHVRASFFALNVLADTFAELVKRQDNEVLVDATSALHYLIHELFDRITIMKLWDGMPSDDDRGKSD